MPTFSAQLSAYYRLDVIASVVQQDVANNRSLVHEEVKIVKTYANTYASANTGNNVAVARDGVQIHSASFTYNTNGQSEILLWAADTWITHDSDGTKAYDLRSSVTTLNIGSASNVGGTVTLPTIARASKPTLSATHTDCGSNVTVYTNRQSTSFTHVIRYQLGSASGTIDGNAGASAVWTLPMSLLNQFPSKTAEGGYIYVDTFSGSTFIGTESVAFIARAGAAVKPTVTGFTATETTAGLAENIGAFVQLASQPRIQMTGVGGVYGSTITSATIKLGSSPPVSGQDITFSGAPLPTAGSIPVVLTVTDTRGRIGTFSGSITVMPWSPPVLEVDKISRRGTAAGTGTELDTGTYIRIDLNSVLQSIVVGGTERNSATYTLEYRAVGGTTWTLDRTGSRALDTSTAFIMASQTLPDTSSREYRLTVYDEVGGAIITTVMASTVLVHLDAAAGVGIRKRRANGALDVLGDIYTSAAIYLGSAMQKLAGIATLAQARTAAANDLAITPAVLKDMLPVRGKIAGTGTAVAVGGNVNSSITFPAGRFTSPPIVVANSESGRFTCSPQSVTVNGATIQAQNNSPAAGPHAAVHWIAMDA